MHPNRRGSATGRPPFTGAAPDRPAGTPVQPASLPACLKVACRTPQDNGLAAYILPADGVCLVAELTGASEA
jgi:hypothetical protein